MTFPGKAINRLFEFSFRNLLSRGRSSSHYIKTHTNILSLLKSDTTTLFGIQPIRNNFCFLSSSGSVKTRVRAMAALSPLDPSSFSRPELAKIKHVTLSLNVDFEKKVLSGEAVLNFDVLDDIDDIILDVRDLNIESIESDGKALEYKIGEHVPNFGSKLTVKLQKPESSGHTCCVNKVEVGKDVVETPLQLLTPDVCSIQDYTESQHKLALTFTGFMYHPPKTDLVVVNPDVGVQTSDDVCEMCEKKKRTGCCRPGISLKIKYSTAPTASGLQWLDPQQTSGKKEPYLFSQCQPIHARSILPCQDTPAVKFTYEAAVTAPPQFTVLMSALRGESAGNTTSFRQPMPLPSYLVAIAVGVLESRTLGPRSKVWSEKEEIERSAWEFADTEKYLQAAERLCGPYEWTQYDLLLLPPSFPYGGMENPCLTFVTPTLLAGDRSQADVIVHEIMHSWTGNLVTNRNFEHFWLNEGFTVFLERKVGASLIDDPVAAKKHRDFQSILGLQELNETINGHLGADNALTRLVPNLHGVHPDDAFSRVPYEKGSLFLRYLEDLLQGPEVFDEFLRAYLTKFKRKSLDTNEFKAFLFDYFKDSEKLASVDWDAWFYTSGMPPVIPNYDPSMSKSVTTVVESINATTPLSYSDVANFTPHQMVYLLQSLVDRPSLPIDTVKTLGAVYKVDSSQNTEIKFRWLRLCIRCKDKSKLNDVFDFVNSQGRMKYVRPVYRDLYDWEEVRSEAISNFLEHEKYMMHVCAYTLKKDLHIAQ